MRVAISAGAALVAVLALAGAALGDVTRMSLEDCLRTAYEKHPDVRVIRHQVARAEDEARSVRGGLLPLLTAEANVMVWDSELTSSFGVPVDPNALQLPGAPPPFTGTIPIPELQQYVTDLETYMTGLNNFFGGLGQLMGALGGMGDIVIREQVTWGVTLKLTQPLTPLYQVLEGWKARLKMADGTRAHGDTVRADVGLLVATAYFAALQAEAYVTIASSAVAQLQAHLEKAQVFLDQGVIGKNDVLKVAVELANVRQQLIQAETGRTLARANLAVQMGLTAGTPVAPALITPETALPVETVTLEQAVEKALSRRSELRELLFGQEIAAHAASIAWWDLVPKVVLLAQYDHAGGMGSFSEPDTFFAGVALSWEFWDWGRRYYAARAADGEVEELELRREHTEELLRLDVTAKFHQLHSAGRVFELARVAITQAEEALRIEQERFDAAAATSTDVLDAESALTRARANHVNAYYAYLMARAALRRAMGQPIAGEDA